MTCAPRQASVLELTGLIPATAKEAEKVTAQEAWEIDWDRSFQAAQKEGRLTIYAAVVTMMLQKVAPSIKKKYEFTLDVLGGSANEILAKLMRERYRGLYLVDLYMSGLNSSFAVIKPSGGFDPLEPMLILPEVVEPKMWLGGKIPWADKEHMLHSYVSWPNNP